MITPAKINFKIYQGSTFEEVLRWETGTKVYTPITGITKAAPVVVSTQTHTIPINWRVKLTNIVGMTELNSSDSYNQVTGITSNSITINNINSIDYKAYISGGIVEYNAPMDLTGFTARMQLRTKIDSDSVLLELTTENNLIVIDNTNKTITLSIPAATTSTLDFSTAVYSLELISSNGKVISLVGGGVTLVKEITR